MEKHIILSKEKLKLLDSFQKSINENRFLKGANEKIHINGMRCSDFMLPYFCTNEIPDIDVFTDGFVRPVFAVRIRDRDIAVSYSLKLAVERYNIINELGLGVYGIDCIECFAYINQILECNGFYYSNVLIEIRNKVKKVYAYVYTEPGEIIPKNHICPLSYIPEINGIEPDMADGWELHLFNNGIDLTFKNELS